MQLIDPVRFMPEVPESTTDEDIQPCQVRFHFLAKYVTLHDTFALCHQIDHVVWVRVTRCLGDKVLLNVGESNLDNGDRQ